MFRYREMQWVSHFLILNVLSLVVSCFSITRASPPTHIIPPTLGRNTPHLHSATIRVSHQASPTFHTLCAATHVNRTSPHMGEGKDDCCDCGITGNIDVENWDSVSTQLKTVFYFIQGLRDWNFDLLESTLSDDFQMEVLPSSLGIPMRVKGEWLQICKESNILEPGYRVRLTII